MFLFGFMFGVFSTFIGAAVYRANYNRRVCYVKHD